MTPVLDHLLRGSGRVCVLVTLGLVLMGLPSVWAQEADTAQTEPTAVEPAGLDSLPTGDLGPPLRAPVDTSDTDRAYVNADSLSTYQRGGERLQEMFGNVFVRQDTTRLRSDYALRYLNRDELLFVDNVVIYERGDTLRADTVRYDRATEVGHARGNVQLTNGDVLVRSDRATYYAQEKRSVFPDSVTLVDSNRVLRARHGTYWSDEERAEFGGGVKLTEPGTTLFSDSLTYFRPQDRSIARGNVFVDRRGEEAAVRDTTSRTYLFGDWVDNREAERYSRVEGNALLIRVRMDTTGAPSDTLVVKARRLEAFRTDTHRRLVAVTSVQIWQPDLSAVADSAVYDRVLASIPDSAARETVAIDTARPSTDSTMGRTEPSSTPPAPPAPTDTEPDSLAEATVEEPDSTRDRPRPAPDSTSRRPSSPGGTIPDSIAPRRPPAQDGSSIPGWAAQRWDTPVARADSMLPLEETRLFRGPVTWFEDSQVWGDSIRVRARDREPDTVFVRGAAFAAQRDSVLDRIQQLKAHNIAAFFEAGSLHQIRAQPNAQAIRFMAAQNDSLNGAARTSGDRIILRFRDGSVRRIRVLGGTETTYYRKNENIPDPFELDGFQWTPERRPTKWGLLKDPRVPQRLDLDLGPPPPRVARSGAQSPRADSSARVRRPKRPVPPARRGQTPAQQRAMVDSLRRGQTVPPDSMGASPGFPVPADTSETQPPKP